jgi:hypothetical protein
VNAYLSVVQEWVQENLTGERTMQATRILVVSVLFVISLIVCSPGFSQPPFETQGWDWTLSPAGQIWAYQHTEKDPTSTWDYGADLMFQIGEGYHQAIWFGAGYRQGAGFDDTGSITPFNPRHIDSAQFLSWRWQFANRLTVFTHVERWCYHEIDIRSPMSVFSTNTGFGIGTTSPVESFNATSERALWANDPAYDIYLFAGPMIHGGVSDILGNQPLRQGLAEGNLAGVWPLYKSLMLEARAQWELMLLRESADVRWRHRGDLRLSLLVQRAGGNVSAYVGYHPHDDYPDRRWPVSMYLGIAYRL